MSRRPRAPPPQSFFAAVLGLLLNIFYAIFICLGLYMCLACVCACRHMRPYHELKEERPRVAALHA